MKISKRYIAGGILVSLLIMGGIAAYVSATPSPTPTKTLSNVKLSDVTKPTTTQNATVTTLNLSQPFSPVTSHATVETPVKTVTTAAPNTTTPTSNPSASPANTQQSSPPTITAVSATVSGWSAPIPQPPVNGNAVNDQYEYCVYTYSDGSTKQATYKLKETTDMNGNGNTITYGAGDVSDCNVATAPTPN